MGLSRPSARGLGSIEAFDEDDAVAAGPVVVPVHTLDLEAERAVGRNRHLVDRRGDRVERRPARAPRLDREPLVELPGDASAAMTGGDADEVDVRLVEARGREE